eukprot:TRINITY_DN1209_c0_g1_i1.p1 TRINITY_DN1209_c0_g1~~TRINITY_DN1209_c0_g1_i1.p1  ORF type:complete len:189 (-),score=69.18 TRINITY_DN1209_c0_g1_i1:420-986(-)
MDFTTTTSTSTTTTTTTTTASVADGHVNGKSQEELEKEDPNLLYYLNPKLTTVIQEEDEILANMVERAKYIPIRLGKLERKRLRLLEAILQVTEYTTLVDKVEYLNKKSQRQHQQMKGVCSILTGIVLSCDLQQGTNLITEKDFHEYEELYQEIFEVGRRHKVMNPEKMRSEYGKMIYILQDIKAFRT